LAAVWEEEAAPGRFFRFWVGNGTALPAFVQSQPFDKSNTVKVWRVVEKKTDVNLALRMYRDACRGEVDQAVLVSNDSDAEPTLRALAEEFPSVRLGVVMPLPHPVEGDKRGRPASRSLNDLAHWCRTYIRDDELGRAPQVRHFPVQFSRSRPSF